LWEKGIIGFPANSMRLALPYIERDFPVVQVNELAVREVNARKPVYQLHKWWARRSAPTFRAIILATFFDKNPMELFYQSVNLKKELGRTPVILDPFMGGGTTVVEGLRLKAKVIGIDINPVAWFITRKEIEPVDIANFKREAERIERAVSEKVRRLYSTTCNAGHEADIMYVFWVKVVNCENCSQEVRLFNTLTVATDNEETIIYCPTCSYVFPTKTGSKTVVCPKCSTRISPDRGNVEDNIYKCPKCGLPVDVVSAIRKGPKPVSHKMFAIQFYCPKCDRKGYKRIDESDQQLFKEAEREFSKSQPELMGILIPDQAIPEGLNTRQILNYGYTHWHQLFNPRQKLCLAMILKEILACDNDSLREFLLLTFSDSLNANNMLCKYNLQASKLEPLFGHHAFWPPQMPVENNVWGTKYGRGSFKAYLGKAIKALEYAERPYGIRVNTSGKRERIYAQSESIHSTTVTAYEGFVSDEEASLLLMTSSENLKGILPDESVDAVITDPPYYDNVMYSELSDFFYVWLRLGLRSKYPKEFGAPLVDNKREIVVNEVFGKDAKFYVDSMQRCLAEANRVLRRDGLLVMTFHHASPEAWSAILKALVDAGFVVVSSYPVHSETRSGVHPGIEYDSILVAQRAIEENLPNNVLPATLLEAEIRNHVEVDADRFITNHPKLTIEDLYVMVMGRALQVLSDNYAAMRLRSGKSPSKEELKKALEGLGDIAFDILLRKFFVRIPDVDRLSKIYASVFAGREYIDMDTIDKVTKHGMLDMKVFESEVLIGEKKKSMRKVVQPEERRSHIEEKLKRGHSMLYVDAAQMLLLAWNEGRFNRAIGDYVRNGIEKEKILGYIKFLYERTGIRVWGQILREVEQTPASSLEKWL